MSHVLRPSSVRDKLPVTPTESAGRRTPLCSREIRGRSNTTARSPRVPPGPSSDRESYPTISVNESLGIQPRHDVEYPGMSTTSCDWILELLEIRAWFYLRLSPPAPQIGVRDPVVLKDGPWGCKVFPVGSPAECGGQHQLARDTYGHVTYSWLPLA